MSQVAPRLPRGMRDFLPEQMLLRQYVIGVIERTFKSFGFEPLETPAVELRSVLMGKYGEEAERLIYDVRHPGGKEELALRYDLTVPLTRVMAMNPTLRMPFKRYQIAPVWRAERPAKGRYRQFYQCDADIVGSESMLADAEIIAIIYQALSKLGFRQFAVEINHRQLLAALGEYCGVSGDAAGALYRSIDKLSKIGEEGVKEELRAGGVGAAVSDRLLDVLRIGGEPQELIADIGKRLAGIPTAEKGLADLAELIGYLGDLGVPPTCYRLNFSMVRGLSYYTGPIYETLVEEPRIGSITGGGRYDDLVGLFTSRSLPVTGTTLGIERIIDVIEELGMYPPALGKTTSQVLLTLFDETTVGESLRLSTELRRAGYCVEVSFNAGKLGKQIRYASEKGIPFLVILGPDEMKEGKVALRDMEREEQEALPRSELLHRLKAWMDRRAGI